MRTLTQMRLFARYMLDEKTATMWDDTELDLFMNFEYNNLVHEIINSSSGYYEESVTLACTPGSEYISLPSNHGGKVISLKRGTIILSPKTQKEIELANADPTTASGEPTIFCLTGKRVRVSPIPTAATPLTLVQNYIPADLVSGTSETPDFPLGYETLIPLGTVLFALMKDKQEMERVYRKYETMKDRMLVSLKSRQTWEPRRVRDV